MVILKKKISYFFLYALSFYPLMKEAGASITAILFLGSTFFFYRNNFKERFKRLGVMPMIINCGFYVLLLLSILYSESIYIGFSKIQSSLLLLFFPIAIFYFFPKIDKKALKLFSYGFIISNFILFVYFFNILVEGLTIDRFSSLTDKNFIEQAIALNKYPYEFVLSKAEKHLNVFYESHKAYLSMHFLMALILSINLMLNFRIHKVKKILLGVLSFLFVCAIIYCQSLSTVLSLILILFLSAFFYMKGKIWKIIYIGGLGCLILVGIATGWFDQYNNKNTQSVTKLLEYVASSSSHIEEGMDKRFYIYDCAISLVQKRSIFGYGVGDVQQNLNECYKERNYVIAEYKSRGFDINSHNYYFHVWLSAGFFSVGLLLYLFANNIHLSYSSREFTYLFFLIMFVISLLTENVLSRMLGVFIFAIFNTLFFSICSLNETREG